MVRSCHVEIEIDLSNTINQHPVPTPTAIIHPIHICPIPPPVLYQYIPLPLHPIPQLTSHIPSYILYPTLHPLPHPTSSTPPYILYPTLHPLPHPISYTTTSYTTLHPIPHPTSSTPPYILYYYILYHPTSYISTHPAILPLPSDGCSKPQSTIARNNSGFNKKSRKPVL